MTKRMINVKEKTIMEIIFEYSFAVHTDQPELFTYFNPEEAHILASFTSPTFAEQWIRDIFEWAHRNYGDDIPNLTDITEQQWNTFTFIPKVFAELLDECVEWLGEGTDFKEEVYKPTVAALEETG